MTDAPLFNDVGEGPADGRAVWLKAGDGVRIRAAVWNQAAPKGTAFLLPGRTEYVEKYGRAATELAGKGYATLSIDWRGQGMADRALTDPMNGHVGNFAEYQDDLDTLIRFATTAGLPQPWYLLPHSMGGCIGLRALMRGLPFKAASFSAPMWGILIAAWMRPLAHVLTTASRWLAFDTRYAPGTSDKAYVLEVPFAGNTLTTDPEMWDYMKRQATAHPDLSLAGPSYGWLKAALAECAALARMPSPKIPAVVAVGLQERIIDTAPVHARMARWPGGRLDLYPAAEHELMMERPATRAAFLHRSTDLFDACR